MKLGVITFPGSLDDRDTLRAAAHVGLDPVSVWHDDDTLDVDAVVLPGGFSHGDNLRCGAIASRSRIMKPLRAFADAGKPVLGICNGFQILTEAGLLPGALTRNESLRFVSRPVDVHVRRDTPWSQAGATLRLPSKHGEGRWVCDENDFAQLESNGQIVFTYGTNPNGSMHDVAGVSNAAGNVVGLMPHPEHAVDGRLGEGTDGAAFFMVLATAVS